MTLAIDKMDGRGHINTALNVCSDKHFEVKFLLSEIKLQNQQKILSSKNLAVQYNGNY